MAKGSRPAVLDGRLEFAFEFHKNPTTKPHLDHNFTGRQRPRMFVP
jgi:hypothetical protein